MLSGVSPGVWGPCLETEEAIDSPEEDERGVARVLVCAGGDEEGGGGR